MSREYTAENVLDLVREVFNITVMSNKDRTEWLSRVCFPGNAPGDGYVVMAGGGKGKDYYDGLYILLWKIANWKRTGNMPENVHEMSPYGGEPLHEVINLLKQKGEDEDK